jgi:ribonuclease J
VYFEVHRGRELREDEHLHHVCGRRGCVNPEHVEVVTAEDHFVHVSGHPCRDELIAMYQMVRPRIAIPVHGEARHLIGHADLARQCQVTQAVVIENGDVVRLDSGGAAIVDEIPAGRIASDGKSLLPIRGAVLQQRRRAGVDGTAVASLVVDRAGSLVAPPQISLIGLAESTSEPAAAVREALTDAVQGMPAAQRRDDEALRDTARRVLRRVLKERFGKRPLVEVQLVRLGGKR